VTLVACVVFALSVNRWVFGRRAVLTARISGLPRAAG